MAPNFFPRERRFPLLPEPYGPIVLQNNLRGKLKDWGLFTPDLDTQKFTATLSLTEKQAFEGRAASLQWLANKNEDIHASEYTWEADIRSIVFREIIQDEQLVVYAARNLGHQHHR